MATGIGRPYVLSHVVLYRNLLLNSHMWMVASLMRIFLFAVTPGKPAENNNTQLDKWLLFVYIWLCCSECEQLELSFTILLWRLIVCVLWRLCVSGANKSLTFWQLLRLLSHAFAIYYPVCLRALFWPFCDSMHLIWLHFDRNVVC